MKIFEWMAELRYRNNILYRVGMIHFIIGILLIIPIMSDQRQVQGINAWIKPLKFCISVGIYSWTFAWILFDLPNSRKWIKGITWTIAITMIVDTSIILYQAGRGTQSHFNMESPLDGILFGMMGIMVTLNTLAIIVTFILLLWKKPNLDRAYLLGLRLAFVVFIIGNWIGGLMIKNMSHSVGVEDGGPGLPIVNWSTLGGDLRIAHFIGLHAIQIIPLFSFFLLRKTSLSLNHRTLLTILFTIIYGGLVSLLYYQAIQGRPLIQG